MGLESHAETGLLRISSAVVPMNLGASLEGLWLSRLIEKSAGRLETLNPHNCERR